MRYVLAQVTAQPVAEPDPWDPDIAALLRMSSFSRYTSLVFRPHRSTTYTYVDAAHCYRRSSVVCRSVTVVSPEKPLNQARCRLGYGLGWVQGNTY